MTRLDAPQIDGCRLYRLGATANVSAHSLGGRLRVDWLVNNGTSHLHAVDHNPVEGQQCGLLTLGYVIKLMRASGADASVDEYDALRRYFPAAR